ARASVLRISMSVARAFTEWSAHLPARCFRRDPHHVSTRTNTTASLATFSESCDNHPMARGPTERRYGSSLQITEVRIPRIDPRAERDTAPPPAAREHPRNRETLARPDAPAPPSLRPSSASLRPPGSLAPGPLDEHGALVRAARLHRQIAQLQEQL